MLPACERAVMSAPDHGGIRDSRGLAFALSGDIASAIADFEFFVHWAKETGAGRNDEWRRAWIAALKADEDPFDEATVDALRNE